MGWYCCCGASGPETGDDCSGCISGTTPKSLSVAISGFANDTCLTCAGYDGTYVIQQRVSPYCASCSVSGSCVYRGVFEVLGCTNWDLLSVQVNIVRITAGPNINQVTIEPRISFGQSSTPGWGKCSDGGVDCDIVIPVGTTPETVFYDDNSFIYANVNDCVDNYDGYSDFSYASATGSGIGCDATGLSIVVTPV